MKFFNIDCHASVISDVSYIFKNLGHQVNDWSLSGHHWVMNKPKASIPLDDKSSIISGGVCNEEVCDKFYKKYKEELEKYDAFIACYPVEFALLYEKWNKPIIIVNCVRYEHPNTFNDVIKSRLDKFLKDKFNQGKLYYVCNNKGDQFYTKYFTNINGMHIPSLCEYTEEKYTGTQKKYILHDRSDNLGINSNLYLNLGSIKNSSWRHSWKELYSYKGIIHVPYHNGSMSTFEQYTANVPLFFPSKEYAKKLFVKNKIFSDLTFYKINNKKEPEDINNPNSLRNPEILSKWIDTCDFYDQHNMPYIQFFDSPSHLEHLLRTVNLSEISHNMENFNKLRKKSVYHNWQQILTSIEKSI